MTFATQQPGVFTAPSPGGVTILVMWAGRWACTECPAERVDAERAALLDGTHPSLPLHWRA